MKRRTVLGYLATGAVAGFLPGRALAASDALVPSGPIRITRSGTILEGLDILADGPGIVVEGLSDITIRNCRVSHRTGGGEEAFGILATKVAGLTIDNCEVMNIGAPPRGPLASTQATNIMIRQSRDVTLRGVTVRRGSTGTYLQQVHNSRIERFESHDIRGPYPRGAALQIAEGSGTHVAEDLSDESIPGTSHNEDSFNVYNTPNVTIRRLAVPMMSDAKSGRGIVIEQFGSVDCLLEQAEFGWLFNGSIGLHGRRLQAIKTRTRGWNRYSVRGFSGSSLDNKNPPAMLAFFSPIPSLKVDHLYWQTASTNLIYNPDGNSGIRNREMEWEPQLRVIRNAHPWRPMDHVPEAVLPVRIGSYWQPNPNTGEDGPYGNTIVPGAILAALPGTYLHDPTDHAWQWYRNGESIPGATGLNYTVTRRDMGAEIVVVELPSNAAGAGAASYSAPVFA